MFRSFDQDDDLIFIMIKVRTSLYSIEINILYDKL